MRRREKEEDKKKKPTSNCDTIKRAYGVLVADGVDSRRARLLIRSLRPQLSLLRLFRSSFMLLLERNMRQIVRHRRHLRLDERL